MQMTPPGPRGSAKLATMATDNWATDAAKKLVAAPRRALKAVRRLAGHGDLDGWALVGSLGRGSQHTRWVPVLCQGRRPPAARPYT